MKNENSAGKVITGLLTLVLLGWGWFSTCTSGVFSTTNVKGTYEWDYNGYTQTIIINSKGDTGPCVWIGESGDTSNESYQLYEHIYDRPQLYIRGMVYIDVQNNMVYSSDDDFRAYRNGRPCRITR